MENKPDSGKQTGNSVENWPLMGARFVVSLGKALNGMPLPLSG